MEISMATILTLFLVIIYIFCIIMLLAEKAKISQHIGIRHIFLIIALIFITPILLFKLDFLNYLIGKGEIGDSIGGFTAPIIGGLNAILVYMAFKQQIKANKFLKRFETEKLIIESINWLKEDKYEIDKIRNNVENGKKNLSEERNFFVFHVYFQKATYLLYEFSNTNENMESTALSKKHKKTLCIIFLKIYVSNVLQMERDADYLLKIIEAVISSNPSSQKELEEFIRVLNDFKEELKNVFEKLKIEKPLI